MIEELKRAFDRSFAAPPPGDPPPLEDFLAVTVGGAPFAIRLRDLKGIAEARSVVPIPSRRPELLGLAGVRGVPVPVFRLSALLGLHDEDPPRWILLCGDLLGLAIPALDGYLRVESVSRREVVDLPSLIRRIQD